MITTSSKTCTYEARQDDPSNWNGEKPEDWLLDEDSWSCPHEQLNHEAVSESEYCIFHMDPEDVPDDLDEAVEFVRVVNEESNSDDPVQARRRKEFVGATFGRFEIKSRKKLSTTDDFPIRFTHAHFKEGITASGVFFHHGIDARGVTFSGGDVDFSFATFNGEAPRKVKSGISIKLSPLNASFSHATFSSAGNVSFSNTTFSGAGYVSFSDATFSGADGVSFWEATFSVGGTVFFSGATFSGGAVEFVGTEFSGAGRVLFLHARFSGADGVSFSYARFSGAGGVSFENTEFKGGAVSFWPTTFSGGAVSFRQTTFSGDGVDFSGATFGGDGGVSFSDATFSGDSGVSFSYARFSAAGGVSFENTEFSADGDVDFSNATLETANFSGNRLGEVNFSGATLKEEVNLSETNLTKANFNKATIKGTDFRNSIATGIDLTGATLTGADFSFTDFAGGKYRNVNFSGAILQEVDFSKADLYKTAFENTDLREAVFDEADCRQARFDSADLEKASFIECDLRSADLADANLYHAAVTDSKMNISTTISNVFIYSPIRPEEEALRPLHQWMIAYIKRIVGDQSAQSQETEQTLRTVHGEPVTGKQPWRNRVDRLDLATWLDRRAWSHQMVHRQLIRTGRIEQALEEKHYLDEEIARLQKARLELRRSWGRLLQGRLSERTEPKRSPDDVTDRDSSAPLRTVLRRGRRYRTNFTDLLRRFVAVLNLKISILLVRMSESPIYVGQVILLVATAFAFVFYLFPDFVQIQTTPVWGGSLQPPAVRRAWQLFVFSLLTFLEGTYLVLKGIFGGILPFGEFEPPGVSVTDVSGIEPVEDGIWIAWTERVFGALLIVPFALLAVQRVALYLGSGVSEEGLGGGLLSWLLGK